MARRLFDMIDHVEVLQHWYSGRSKTGVATSLGIDRGTIRKYVAPAEAAGMVPGGVLMSRAEWAALAAGWFPELVDAKVNRPIRHGCLQHRRLYDENTAWAHRQPAPVKENQQAA